MVSLLNDRSISLSIFSWGLLYIRVVNYSKITKNASTLPRSSCDLFKGAVTPSLLATLFSRLRLNFPMQLFGFQRRDQRFQSFDPIGPVINPYTYTTTPFMMCCVHKCLKPCLSVWPCPLSFSLSPLSSSSWLLPAFLHVFAGKISFTLSNVV
jgi:hypothetical protein